MKPRTLNPEFDSERADESLTHAIREIIRAVRSVTYGSIEVVIQNSRIVQIERKEKFRFDRS